MKNEIKTKFFKNNPNFVWTSEYNFFSICAIEHYDADMLHFLKNVDYFLEHSAGPFFKKAATDSTKIGVVALKHKCYVVKRYNQKGMLHTFLKTFRQSRALRSWLNSFYLETIGVATLQPVAVVINRSGLFRGKTYFITEYASGERGCDYFGEDKSPNPNWAEVIKNIGTMTQRLQAAGLVHDDYQYGNILLQHTTPLLLDLDHMRVYKRNSRLFRLRFRKDVKHFLDFLNSNPVAKKEFEIEFRKAKLLG